MPRSAEGRPATTILEVARDKNVDMIVLGSRGLSEPKALFLGSVSHKVVNLAERTLRDREVAGRTSTGTSRCAVPGQPAGAG
jgi:hypothetical protein